MDNPPKQEKYVIIEGQPEQNRAQQRCCKCNIASFDRMLCKLHLLLLLIGRPLILDGLVLPQRKPSRDAAKSAAKMRKVIGPGPTEPDGIIKIKADQSGQDDRRPDVNVPVRNED